MSKKSQNFKILKTLRWVVKIFGVMIVMMVMVIASRALLGLVLPVSIIM